MDEKVVPMEDRWYRKIYSFCKGSTTDEKDNTVFDNPLFYNFTPGCVVVVVVVVVFVVFVVVVVVVIPVLKMIFLI